MLIFHMPQEKMIRMQNIILIFVDFKAYLILYGYYKHIDRCKAGFKIEVKG